VPLRQLANNCIPRLLDTRLAFVQIVNSDVKRELRNAAWDNFALHLRTRIHSRYNSHQVGKFVYIVYRDLRLLLASLLR